eukprot:CAMPEP_0182433676 /NCGR_PEP_ID=MMETSP1167-20130531/64842_1 /TAXON_ID=2988 /ORGANISM="Mallomonas Sp, Strain CCMP3275" /LENGTH=277 /DNA_ID=CAMNT_0024622667 /DNA_START=394 /DNA_END=1227 /DNA_ORIENTATION=+
MPGATAQVTPLELTEKLMEAATARGAEVIIGEVEEMVMTEEGKGAEGGRRVYGLRLKGREVIPVDKLILTMGVWTSVYAEDWFGMTLPMDGIKSTSVVFSNCEAVKSEPYACFCDEDVNGCHLEIYPRPNGEVYLCGIGGSDYVRGDRLRAGGDCAGAEDVKEDEKRVAAAVRSFSGLSASLGGRQPDIVQACMRPCPPDGLPYMGTVPDIENAYISAGHNCWGILWAPISGLCMSELVCDGESSTVDLSAFRPDRYMKRQKKRGRKQGEKSVGEQW